jgi:hypothetical protein
MPEMARYCRQYFSVARRAEQISTGGVPGAHGEFGARAFHHNDVVTLDGLRCSGLAHSGCQRGCLLFWKEAWLVASRSPLPLHASPPVPVEQLIQSLRTTGKEGRFFCQSSEMLRATHPMSAKQRWQKCLTNVRVGNYRWFEMSRMLLTWLGGRIRRTILGAYPKGSQNPTPEESQHLHPGELVEVKSLEEIVATLDRKGTNRGLHFSPDMIRHCGRRYRVHTRADKLISEGTGLLINFPNTVILEDVICDSATFFFGGCARENFLLWREIWLKRIAEGDTNTLVTKSGRSTVKTAVDGRLRH